MTTATTTAKQYQVTLQLKSIPTEVRDEIVAKVTEQYDKMTELIYADSKEKRIANREMIIENKIENEIWMWKYDRQELHTIFADNKADATKQARQLANQLGLQFVYVYYTPNKKEA